MVLSIDQLIEAFNTISSLSPLTLTFQLIYQNLFLRHAVGTTHCIVSNET